VVHKFKGLTAVSAHIYLSAGISS